MVTKFTNMIFVLKQPNKEHMEMPGLHSLEHLMAENIRNHTDKVVDLSPMGCQTGFYVSFINHDDYEDVLDIVEKLSMMC